MDNCPSDYGMTAAQLHDRIDRLQQALGCRHGFYSTNVLTAAAMAIESTFIILDRWHQLFHRIAYSTREQAEGVVAVACEALGCSSANFIIVELRREPLDGK